MDVCNIDSYTVTKTWKHSRIQEHSHVKWIGDWGCICELSIIYGE